MSVENGKMSKISENDKEKMKKNSEKNIGILENKLEEKDKEIYRLKNIISQLKNSNVFLREKVCKMQMELNEQRV